MSEAHNEAKAAEAAGPAASLVALIAGDNWKGAIADTARIAGDCFGPWMADEPLADEMAKVLETWVAGKFRETWGDEGAAEVEGIWRRARRAAEPNAPEENKAQAEGAGAAEAKAALAKLGLAPQEVPDAPLPPEGATELERLTYPRGLLGHATQYIEDTAAFPDRWLSLATALSACGKALDRKVLGPMDNSVLLWLILLAETGAGKQHALNCLRILLRAMGVEEAYVAGGLGSVQGIEEILKGTAVMDACPNALVAFDEAGAWLKRITSGGQTGNVAEIPALLQSLWGWPPQLEWTGSKTKGMNMDVVHGPAFALFGVSTEGKFIKALTGEQISNGFVNRMLLVNIGRGAEKRAKTKYNWLEFPSWLATALKKVAGPKRPDGPMRIALQGNDGKPVVLQDFRRIGWGPGAEERWQDYEDGVRATPSVEDRKLWIRAPENALRLATIVAAFRGSSVVDVEDLEWAIAVVDQSMRWLVKALRKNMIENLHQVDLVEKIREEFLKILKKNKKGEPAQLTQGQIRKLLERLTDDHRKIDQAIDHMVKCGDIFELDQVGKVGRATRKWQWEG